MPCHDEPALLRTLERLAACELPACAVEVIVVFGGSESDLDHVKAQNLQTFARGQSWSGALEIPQIRFHFLSFLALPKKHAGVGLTRKIGMDEAVDRFALADNPRGIIVSLDADTLVERNYLRAIEQYFEAHRKVDSCSMAFEFQDEFAGNPMQAEAILRIELAERILVAGLRHCGHPYAFHTLGAAMAVRTGAYQAQAGMNKRKTGEDFDFLQKFIELGVHGDCVAARVYPSSRISQRKPGGIGQRVALYCATPDPDFPVFALESFVELAEGLKGVKTWYALGPEGIPQILNAFPPGLHAYMQEAGFLKVIPEIQRYTNSEAAFEKRFYRWFNSLKTFQYFAFCRDRFHPDQPILAVGNAMRSWMLGGMQAESNLGLTELLKWFRMRAEEK